MVSQMGLGNEGLLEGITRQHEIVLPLIGAPRDHLRLLAELPFDLPLRLLLERRERRFLPQLLLLVLWRVDCRDLRARGRGAGAVVDLFAGDAPGARHALAQGGGAEGVAVVAFAGRGRCGLDAQARRGRTRC